MLQVLPDDVTQPPVAVVADGAKVIHPTDCAFVSKPWGWESWLFNDEEANYCLKMLFLKAGQRGSIHRHPVKDEVLTCHTGSFYMRHRVELPSSDIEEMVHGNTVRIDAGMSIRIFPGTWHQLAGSIDATIYEASTFHSDDDVERIDDWKQGAS